MAHDSAAEVAAISRFFAFEGTLGDLISQGAQSFFHYTDFNAFAGIVMKGDLWLTDARFSNDAEELEHGRTLIAEELGALCEDPRSDLRDLARDTRTELDRDRGESADAVYVCCFCEEGDLLSQWRGYTAQGGGVSIQIDPQAFGPIAGIDCPIGLMRFWKVFYDDARKRSKVRQVVEFWAGAADPLQDRALYAATTLRFLMPTFKNSRFGEEAEWRLIFTPGPTCTVPPRFRTSRGLLVPYFELRDLVKSFAPAAPPPLAIKQVRVGPGPYKDVNARSSRLLLQSYGYAADVELSDIPYRA